MYINCIECPFHLIVADPDPYDWFNADDEAIVCKKVPKEKDIKSTYTVDRTGFKPIDVALRPYQTKNVKSPDWCPISTSKIRDEKLEKILT